MQQARYKAFISYSHKDDKWAAWLHRALEAYKPPKHLVGQTNQFGQIPRRLSPVFRDREELPSATDLGHVIDEALMDSATQIVVCSPAAAKSKWVNEEILAYKRLGREDRIFCLIVDGEPNASDIPGAEDQECFPPALRHRLNKDGELGTERTEPIGADARENKDGKSNAKLKLIAGMLGVGFDALRQRELHRRQRRLLTIAAASIAGMVLTTGLAVSAFLARSEAVAQRARAEAETETARQTTNFLVELFEVSDPSEALGNTITAREILDRGARRIEFELQDQPAIQSTLMDTMGSVYKSLGLYSEARTLIERGLETRRSLYGDRHPDVAQSQANIGQLLGLQADFEAAVAEYEEAIETLRADADADAAQLARSLVGLAEVRSLQGDYAAAEALLREVVEIQRPGSGAGTIELAKTLDQLGVNLGAQARYEEAEPLLREALAMRRTLFPAGVHPELDDSLNSLGVFLYEKGELEETEKLFRESLEIKQQLLSERHPDLALSLSNLGIVLHDMRDYDEAEQLYQRSLDIRMEALGNDHPLTGHSLNNLAFLYYDEGRIDAALELSRRALATFRNAYAQDHEEVAYALQNLARWLVETGDYAQAEPLLVEALAINQRVFPRGHPDIAITRSGMAALLLQTDRADEALQMASSAHASLADDYGAEHWRTAWASALEGAALSKLQRYAAAEPLLVQAYEVLSTAAGVSGSQVDAALRFLVELYTTWGNPEAAQRYRELRSSQGLQ